MNNALQSDTAKSTITINNLNLTVYSLKIEFEDIYVEALEKTLYVAPYTNSSYTIKKKTNGKYKMWLISQISTNPNPNNNQNNNNGNQNNNSNNTIDLNLWGENIAIDLNTLLNQQYVDNGYNNGSKPTLCTPSVSPQSFSQAKQSISAKSFEADKLSMAKQLAGSNCLKSSQVKEIMLLFSFEDSKLDFAKYAYHHTSDINNYYTVNDAFTFSASIDNLNNYINSLK
jgi:hypothetical protein